MKNINSKKGKGRNKIKKCYIHNIFIRFFKWYIRISKKVILVVNFFLFKKTKIIGEKYIFPPLCLGSCPLMFVANQISHLCLGNEFKLDSVLA